VDFVGLIFCGYRLFNGSLLHFKFRPLQKKSSHYIYSSSCPPILPLCGGVDESENVVKDVVAARAVGQELERLGVAHGPLLFVDLVFVFE
jgi:hypothetical protein